MTYSPDMPTPFDIPAANQDDFLSNFSLLNIDFNNDHVPFVGIITNVTQSNPAIVTSTLHTLVTGNTITILPLSVIGMTELNGNTYTITRIDDNTFSLNGTDSTNFITYISGGNYSSAELNSGFHKKITYEVNIPDPNFIAPFASLYPKQTEMIADLFFQNNPKFVDQLTNSQFTQLDGRGLINRGLKTPWGLIINFGVFTTRLLDPLHILSFTTPVTFPVPYTSAATIQTIIASPYAFTGSNPKVQAAPIALSNTQFTLSGQNFSGQATAYYMAIGT